MIREMHDMLARARRRLASLRLWSGLTLWWLALAAIAWGLWTTGALAGQSAWVLSMVFVAVGLAGSIVGHLWWSIESRDPFWTARQIERRHPELGAVLLSALEQAPTPKFRRLGYLQNAVVENAVAHGRSHNWAADVPLGKIWLARMASAGAFALLVAACAMLLRTEAVPTSPSDLAADPDAPAAIAPRNFDVVVEPGNTEIERGTSLLVVAKFGRSVPDEAMLAVR